MTDLDFRKIYEWPLSIQMLVSVLTAMFLFWVIYVLDLRPYQQDILTITQQEDDLRRQFKSLVEKQIEVKTGIGHLPELKSKLVAWQSNLPTASEVHQMQDTILNTAQKDQLKIVNFKPEPIVKEKNYNKNTVNISLEGTYDQIAKYISKLVNMPKLIVVTNLMLYDESLNETEQGGLFKPLNSAEIYSAQIGLEIYSRP